MQHDRNWEKDIKSKAKDFQIRPSHVPGFQRGEWL